ncbi:MAG TPA: VWA domain-containing protein [Terracidiphilus sp.]
MSICQHSSEKLWERCNSILKILKLSALLVLAFSLRWACCQAPALPPGQGTDLSVNANEVSLDLVVHDKKNRPVLDLKQEQIAVTDDGVPVTLNSFRQVSSQQKTERLITLVFDRPGQVVGKTQETDPTFMKSARDAADRLLKMLPESGFSFSVLTVEGRLRLQVPFTSDRKAIEEAIKTATKPVISLSGDTASQPEKQLIAAALTGTDPSGKAVSAKERALDLTLLTALTDSGRITQNQHLRPFLAGLLALAQSQQQITQRKALVFFTSFQANRIDSRTSDAIKSIIGSANLAGESIYIVDLNSSGQSENQLSVRDLGALKINNVLTSGAQQYGQPSAQVKYTGFIENNQDNEGLRHLAEETGGTYVTKDRLQQMLKRMIQDMTAYYVASYIPPIKEYDGKFRPVSVKPLRAGLKIRTRTGYLALPPRVGTAAVPQQFELPLLKILGASPLPADVTFRTAILRAGDTPDGSVSTLAIEVPFSTLEIREDSSTSLYWASLSIVANIKDKTGMVIERFSTDIPRHRVIKNAQMDNFGAVTFQRHFLAPAGQYVLEVAVLDHNSGRAGARRVEFEIPNPSGAPSLGNMLLVRQTEPFHAEDDPAEPLRHGDKRVMPNLSGQLPPGAKDISVFFTAHSDPQTPQAATLKIQVFRNGKALGGAPMISHQSNESEFSSYLTSFAINPPVDGLYEVKAIMDQGGKTAETSTSFTLAGGQPATENEAAVEVSSAAPPRPAGPLVITFPANPPQRPAPDELKSILADATQYAMNYRASLPNFICEQVTNRSVYTANTNGTKQWKHRDKFTELLTYFNHEENRIMLELELNGSTSNDDTEYKGGVMSAGEFGVAFSGLFSASSKADFQWKETGVLGDGTVQVFDYRVLRENSTITLRVSSNDVVTVGYHGQVFIDSATRMVRRITQILDDVPKKYPIQAASVSVDYDYVVINNHDYMLPISEQVITRKGRWQTDLNEIEYRNFHRFGSTVKILDYSPIAHH